MSRTNKYTNVPFSRAKGKDYSKQSMGYLDCQPREDDGKVSRPSNRPQRRRIASKMRKNAKLTARRHATKRTAAKG